MSDAPTPAQVGNLNMSNDHDRGLVRRLADDGTPASKRPRWPGIDDATKTQFIKALRYALSLALEVKDNRGINGCVKTLAALEGQNQADDHLDDKNARLDAGKPTGNEAITVRYVNQFAPLPHDNRNGNPPSLPA